MRSKRIGHTWRIVNTYRLLAKDTSSTGLSCHDLRRPSNSFLGERTSVTRGRSGSHKIISNWTHYNSGSAVCSDMFEQSPEQRLIVTCNPVRPWKFSVPDRRKLGLPMFSIEFTPIEEAISAPDALPASAA